jgi:hypothetical protein
MIDEGNEKRHFSRIPFDAGVRLKGVDGETATQLIDVSLKGALVTRPADWHPKVGDSCQLELVLGDNHEAAISMEVTVAHREAERVGLRCQHIDLDSITHLRRLVELNLGDPELLDRELAALG